MKDTPAIQADTFPPAATRYKTQAGAPPMTVDEFCHRYHMSRSTYYRLRREGLTPVEIRLGRKGIITAESARLWEHEQLQKAGRIER